METVLVFISMIVMCCTAYGLMEMYINNKKYPVACKVIYIPEKKTNVFELYLKKKV